MNLAAWAGHLVAAAAIVVGTLTACSPDRACESIPIPKYNLAGVTYTARQIDDTVSQADLGDVLGTQVGDVPKGLIRCQAVKLKNGEGSLATGAHVYAIHGVDKSIAIAAQTGTQYIKLYAP